MNKGERHIEIRDSLFGLKQVSVERQGMQEVTYVFAGKHFETRARKAVGRLNNRLDKREDRKAYDHHIAAKLTAETHAGK